MLLLKPVCTWFETFYTAIKKSMTFFLLNNESDYDVQMTLNYSESDRCKCCDLIGWEVIAPAVLDHMLG